MADERIRTLSNTRNIMTIDVKQTLNYSAAIRKAEPDWDDDQVRRAAEHCVLYMDVRIKPAKLKKHLEDFKDSSNYF